MKTRSEWLVLTIWVIDPVVDEFPDVCPQGDADDFYFFFSTIARKKQEVNNWF